MKLNAKKMILIILSMVGFAMFDSLKGVFLPKFVSTYQTNYSLMGTLFLVSSLAYMVGSYIGGRAINWLGKAKTMQLSALLNCIGMAIIVFIHAIAGLFAGFILVGFATAVSAMVINTTVPQLDVKNHALLMNFVHFLYGFGAAVVVRFAGVLINYHWQYPAVYAIGLAIFVAMFVLSLNVHLPEQSEEKSDHTPFSTIEKRLIVLFGIAIGSHVIAEIQTGAWLINYIVNVYHYSENNASTYMSLFFLVLSLGRLVGGLIAHRVGYLKTVTISLLIAIAMYLGGLLAGQAGLYVIAFSGLFFAVCFPTIVLSLKLYFPKKLNRAMGIIMTISVGINVMSNYPMGYLSDNLGVYWAMFVIPVALLISMTILIYIQYHFKFFVSNNGRLFNFMCNIDID